jgi:hypothetical protein
MPLSRQLRCDPMLYFGHGAPNLLAEGASNIGNNENIGDDDKPMDRGREA